MRITSSLSKGQADRADPGWDAGSGVVGALLAAALGHALEALREIEELAADFRGMALLGQLGNLGGNTPVIFRARAIVAHRITPAMPLIEP